MPTRIMASPQPERGEKLVIAVITTILLFPGLVTCRDGNRVACEPVAITINSVFGDSKDTFEKGRQVHLTCDNLAAEKYEWRINDSAQFTGDGPSAFYYCPQPGKFIITLTLDGRCQAHDTFYVFETTPLPPAIDTSVIEIAKPVIQFTPKNPKTDEVIVFSESGTTDTAWEWSFGDQDSTKSTRKTPTHTYKERGTYKVTLNVNHDPAQTTSVNITVTGSIDIMEPLCPTISESEFITMLTKVGLKQKFARDFKVYFKGRNIAIPVILNNVNPGHMGAYKETFEQVCTRLEQIKDKRVKGFSSVELKKNAQGCIVSATIYADINADYR